MGIPGDGPQGWVKIPQILSTWFVRSPLLDYVYISLGEIFAPYQVGGGGQELNYEGICGWVWVSV